MNVGDPAPAPLARLSPSELTAEWPPAATPVVSVLCATFNHERYVADALDGILAQRTSFPFEVVVRDDASTDATADIIRSYAADYPGIVVPVLETANRWVDVKPLGAMVPHARGEYLAICEGDDYWTDPGRLERQVAVLRRNPAAVAVYHDAYASRDGVIERTTKVMPAAERGITADALLSGVMTPWVTMLYRNVDQVPVELERRTVAFDLFLHVRLGAHGSAIREPGHGAVQRLHDDSAWFSTTSEAQRTSYRESCRAIAEWLDEHGYKAQARRFRHEADPTVIDLTLRRARKLAAKLT